MMAIAALAPAATAAAAAASVHPAQSPSRAVTAHIRVTATIAVGRQPIGVATDPRTKRIYVANAGSGTVSVISGRTDKVVATVRVGRVPAWVATDPRTDTIYVTDGQQQGAGEARVARRPSGSLASAATVSTAAPVWARSLASLASPSVRRARSVRW
jgi:YVTN family beta-propeller protein